MVQERTLVDADDCIRAIDLMLAHAHITSQAPMALSIVDQYGDPLAVANMNGTSPFVQHFARGKAYTAARMGADLADFAEQLQARGRNVRDYADPNLVAAARGGRVVRTSAGTVVGGVGVSGGTPEQDEEVARVGVAVLVGG